VSDSSLQFDPARVKRVLIYRLGSLGDTLVALPALRVVERAFPQARRLLLTNIPVHAKAPSVASILEGTQLAHGYVSYPVGTRRIRDLAAVWWRIRRFRPEVLVYLTSPRGEETVRRDARFFRLCGIPQVVGLPLGGLAKNQFDPGTALYEPEAERLLRCVRLLGAGDAQDLRNWDLGINEAEKKTAQSALGALDGKPVIACGPGTKWPSKDWGPQNWRVLLARLSATLPDRALLLVGAKEDAEVSDFVAAEWRSDVLNLCGKLTPRETAAALQNAELFLGPDSGPMHMAAAAGVPCAIAFSAIDLPGRWFPIGDGHRPIYHKVDCAVCKLEVCVVEKKRCLTSITVDEMFAAAMEAWKNGRVLGAKNQQGR
jgi:lipopolysaccharide heptosyltransferase III